MCVRMIYYFKMGYNRSHIWHLMGADQPGDRGCPVHVDTIGSYLSQIRDRVAVVGIQKMLQVRLAGPCQADESFVRTQRKHNSKNARNSNNVFLVVGVDVGVFFEYPQGLHGVYQPLNPSSHVIMRFLVSGILFKSVSWLFEFQTGKQQLCDLFSITFVTRESRSQRTHGRGTTSSDQTVGDT